MIDSLTLAQQHFYTFRACHRRFYLRYLAKIPWPEPPLDSDLETAYERGRLFHRWVERQLLGLPIDSGAQIDPVIHTWWTTFQKHSPSFPPGRRFVEFTLIAPIGRHFVAGRYDLLIVNQEDKGQPDSFIFDWKTGEPRPIDRLRQAWQTRIYLAVLAEGGTALAEYGNTPVNPDHLTFIYWYVEDPLSPRVITYSKVLHKENWTDLVSVVQEIDRRLIANDWPLTDDWNECRRCAYRAHCGRQAAGQSSAEFAEEEESLDPAEDWLLSEWT